MQTTYNFSFLTEFDLYLYHRFEQLMHIIEKQIQNQVSSVGYRVNSYVRHL